MSKVEDIIKVEELLKQARETIVKANEIAKNYGVVVESDDLFLRKEWDDSACWQDPDVWEDSSC